MVFSDDDDTSGGGRRYNNDDLEIRKDSFDIISIIGTPSKISL